MISENLSYMFPIRKKINTICVFVVLIVSRIYGKWYANATVRLNPSLLPLNMYSMWL